MKSFLKFAGPILIVVIVVNLTSLTAQAIQLLESSAGIAPVRAPDPQTTPPVPEKAAQLAARTQEAWIETPTLTPEPNSGYFTIITTTLSDGKSLGAYIINGPPKPPPGYQLERATVSLPNPDLVMGTNTLTVPAFN